MSNPYSRKVMRNAPDVPATSQDGIRGGVRIAGKTHASAGPAFGANGEINAGSKKELMAAMGNVVEQASMNVTTRFAHTAEENRGLSPFSGVEKVASVRDAFYDKNGSKFQVVGEVISDEIWETLG